ncbi:diguanylate cyclase domain-containing protein [Promineifilum sp.]|uniref:diguanylate cyclase domain-containing protein n=1 Tax=Promineifilum sp. TaxID=2664178 RepID=UPI0035B0CCBA
MEIQAYWRVLKKRWWLVLFGFAVVFGITYFLTSRQRPVYETSTTFVIRPRTSEVTLSDDFVRALDMVSRRVEINTTFAEVATSRTIKRQAIERLGLSTAEQQGLSIGARVVGGTNVMEITASGHDPKVVRDFANAVGVETVGYVSELYDVFELEPLDEANLPRNPSQPNVVMNLAMGGALGLALGAGLVFLLRYLETATTARESFNIIERDTDAYTRSYLLHRLWGEISRSRRSGRPLSLGLIRVELGSDHDRGDVMRLAKTAIERLLREEDVLARFDSSTFAVLLPDTRRGDAQLLLNKAVTRIRSLPQHSASSGDARKQTPRLHASLGLATYEDGRKEPEQFLDEAIGALGLSGTEYSPEEFSQGSNGRNRLGTGTKREINESHYEIAVEGNGLPPVQARPEPTELGTAAD